MLATSHQFSQAGKINRRRSYMSGAAATQITEDQLVIVFRTRIISCSGVLYRIRFVGGVGISSTTIIMEAMCMCCSLGGGESSS